MARSQQEAGLDRSVYAQFTPGLSQQDWSLHRKGPTDQARHDEKVREAIKDNIGDLLSDHDVMTGDQDAIVKIPVRGLELPKFRFGDPLSGQQVGQGDGKSQVGDKIGKVPKPGQGGGQGAGELPGIDFYEHTMTVRDVKDFLFDQLGLPRMKPKGGGTTLGDRVIFDDVRKNGRMSQVNWRRTAQENIKRNAMKTKGKAAFGELRQEDLRFKTWTTQPKPADNAVLLLLMDASGSMGKTQKDIARVASWWMLELLRSKYENVQVEFITHHTTAQRVSEIEFFTKGESGGTQASSAFLLAKDILSTDYPLADWNAYPVHFSDGDNQEKDNGLCAGVVKDLVVTGVNQFAYLEVGGTGQTNLTKMFTALHESDGRIVPAIARDKKAIFPALQTLFPADTNQVDTRDGSRA